MNIQTTTPTMNTTDSFKYSPPGNGEVRACALPVRRHRFSTEENGGVEFCEFFLRFILLICLLCTLSICLVHIATPAGVSAAGTAGTASTAAGPMEKNTPAVTVRITLPGGFRL